MKDTKSTQSDLEILTQLNADYLASDQNGDVQRYGQIRAEAREAFERGVAGHTRGKRVLAVEKL